MNLLPLLAVSAPDIVEFQKILVKFNSESWTQKQPAAAASQNSSSLLARGFG